MLHAGSVRMKEVMRGLGPSWMGEQISQIDQQLQCYFINPRLVSLGVFIWCAQDFRTGTEQKQGSFLVVRTINCI